MRLSLFILTLSFCALPAISHAADHSCIPPLTYRLAFVDQRFAVSAESVTQALKDASGAWSAAGTPVTQGNSTDAIAISLLYDERHPARQALRTIEGVISTNSATYEFRRSALDARTAAHKANSALVATASAMLETIVTFHNMAVDSWNARGGATPEKAAELNATSALLQGVTETLNRISDTLNREAASINMAVADTNQLARTLNQAVTTYNTIGAEQGTGFIEGTYRRMGIDKKIEVYAFADSKDLTRILAHEFGHALGLEHVASPTALMYEKNSATDYFPTTDDLSALTALCVTS